MSVKSSDPPLRARLAGRPPGLPVLALLLLVGLGASVVFFRWAATGVREGVIGELAARPGVPAEQVELWLRYGEPQIQNRLMDLRYSSALPALVTHVAEPAAAGEPPLVYGIDLSGSRPARVVRADLRVEVRLGAPELLAEGPLRGQGAERVPRASAGVGPAAGRDFARGVFEWALEPLISALPRDVEGGELAVVIEPEPFPRPFDADGAGGPAGLRKPSGRRLVAASAGLLGLALAVGLALRRGRRNLRAGEAAP